MATGPREPKKTPTPLTRTTSTFSTPELAYSHAKKFAALDHRDWLMWSIQGEWRAAPLSSHVVKSASRSARVRLVQATSADVFNISTDFRPWAEHPALKRVMATNAITSP